MDERINKSLWRLSMITALAFIMLFFSIGLNVDVVNPKAFHESSITKLQSLINATHTSANRGPNLVGVNNEVEVDSAPDDDDSNGYLTPHQTSFEEDLVRCTTHAFSDAEKLRKHWLHTPPSNVTCTPSLFREYFKKNHHFYQHGLWYAPNETYPDDVVLYPRDCYFDESVIQPANFQAWLKLNGIKRVLFHGDSNGHMYFKSLVSFFEARSAKCELIREEKGSTPQEYDPYFTVPGLPPVQKYKGCTHCFSLTYFCSGLHGPAQILDNGVTLEYIGMIRILDEKIFYSKKKNASGSRVTKRHTFLEYMFRDYLPYHGMPDLWIMSPPFHHESWEVRFEEHERNMELFADMLDEFVPKSTKLLVLSDSRECAVLQPRWAFEDFMEISNSSKNEVLHSMNQMLFNALETKFVSNTSNVMGFLDMGVLSCPFTCRWHLDGAHMVQGWYDAQIRFIFKYLSSQNL